MNKISGKLEEVIPSILDLKRILKLTSFYDISFKNESFKHKKMFRFQFLFNWKLR